MISKFVEEVAGGGTWDIGRVDGACLDAWEITRKSQEGVREIA
jgi:hypothetical protein